MRNWLSRVLAGRYGSDNLNKFLLGASLVTLVVSLFVKGTASTVCWLAAVACIAWSYARMFSRRIERRQQENLRFMKLKYQLTGRARTARQQWRQRREYRFFRCEHCGVTVRVPKGKGLLRITCPKCGTVFEKRS